MLIGCLIGAIVVVALSGWRVRKEIVRLNERMDSYSSEVANFFTAESDTQGSPFNQVVCELIDIAAEKQAAIVQASIRGSIGGNQRVINQTLAEVGAEANPSLAIANQVLPKSLGKNKLAMAGLEHIITNIMQNMGNAAPASGGNNHNSTGVRFKF